MIDINKMKIAFAATPLCQGKWTEKGDGGSPTKLCAISSLVSFAGVSCADLIPYRCRRLGRKVVSWSARRAWFGSLKKRGAVA